jgi:hypothetical protein
MDPGSEHGGELARMGQVDVDPRVHTATVEAEDAILCELYGPPDTDGFYVAAPDGES